jgi:RimJ/RimL family protein N-acetyltransferase
MEREPLSRLRPPDSIDDVTVQEERTRPPAVPGAHGHGALEWTVTSFDPLTSPHTETFLPGMWKRMHDDGTFAMFFHEAAPEMTFGQFCAALAQQQVYLVMGHDNAKGTYEHAGFVSLTNIFLHERVKRATGNFCFFHEYWNRHDTLAMARAVLDAWFGVLDADCITGVTPRQNRAAIAFVKRIGFTVVGDIPQFTTYENEPSAAAISYMTKTMWRKRYHSDAPAVPDTPAPTGA